MNGEDIVTIITPLIARELESHFKLYPDARLWITKLAYNIHQAIVEWLFEDCDCKTWADITDMRKPEPQPRYKCWKCMREFKATYTSKEKEG